MRTKMPDELKVGDRLVVRDLFGTSGVPILSIVPVHVPVGSDYIPAMAILLEGVDIPVLADPRTAIEVA